jgi:hypothetical protein
MRRRGVCYDVGRVLEGLNWRPVFDPAEVHRELEIIRDELHCNAVRVCGRDLDRLLAASCDALAQGLEVWFSPELWNESPDDTLAYVIEAARQAAGLHDRWPGRVVFSVGSELSLFMRGILKGDTLAERIENPRFLRQVRAGAHHAPLNAFLGRAADAVRAVFDGPLTYASVIYDKVGVDATFVYVFSTPVNAYCDDPRYDFDMANYALVKSYGNRLGDAAITYPPLAAALPHLPWDTTRSGTTYPDMPWEPKQAFHAVARFYAAQANRDESLD